MSDHVLIARFVGYQSPCFNHINTKIKHGNAILQSGTNNNFLVCKV